MNNYKENETTINIITCTIHWFLVNNRNNIHIFFFNMLRFFCLLIWTQPNPKYIEYKFLDIFEKILRLSLKFGQLYDIGSQTINICLRVKREQERKRIVNHNSKSALSHMKVRLSLGSTKTLKKSKSGSRLLAYSI